MSTSEQRKKVTSPNSEPHPSSSSNIVSSTFHLLNNYIAPLNVPTNPKTISQKIYYIIHYCINQLLQHEVDYELYQANVKQELPIVPNCEELIRFKDYQPLIFRRIRSQLLTSEYSGIQGNGKLVNTQLEQKFVESFNDTYFKQMNSKSGALFGITSDHKFIVKTLTKGEAKYLRGPYFLRDYVRHISQQSTFLSIFYGLFRMEVNGSLTRFIVMNHLFAVDADDLDEMYDLKGSTLGRSAKQGEKTLKDLDLLNRNRTFKIGPKMKQLFMLQLRADLMFLESHELMDYSLLVGVIKADKVKNLQSNLRTPSFRSIPPPPSHLRQSSPSVSERTAKLTNAIQASNSSSINREMKKENTTTKHVRSSHHVVSPSHARSTDRNSAPSKSNGRVSTIIEKLESRRSTESPPPSQVSTSPRSSNAEETWTVVKNREPSKSVPAKPTPIPPPPPAHLVKTRSKSILDIVATAASVLTLGTTSETQTKSENGRPVIRTTFNQEKKFEKIDSLDSICFNADGRLKQIPSQDGKEIYFFGIIDFLGKFDIKKKAQNLTSVDREMVSSVPPQKYASRMLNFVDQILQ